MNGEENMNLVKSEFTAESIISKRTEWLESQERIFRLKISIFVTINADCHVSLLQLLTINRLTVHDIHPENP